MNNLTNELNEIINKIKELKTQRLNVVTKDEELQLENEIMSLKIKANNLIIENKKRKSGMTARELLSKSLKDPIYYQTGITAIDKMGGIPLGAFIQLGASSGAGKALDVDEKVLTPNGWKKIGEIEIGEYVIGSNGKKTKVIGVFPQGVRDIYKVSFKDGTSVLCDIEHIWTVFNRHGTKINVTVDEIIKKGICVERYDKRYGTYQKTYNFRIPFSKACEYGNDKDIKIDAYLLGLLIGDGMISGGGIRFCNKHISIINKIKKILPIGCKIGVEYFDKGAYYISIISDKTFKYNPLIEELKLLGLYKKKSKEKFIPDKYKNASLDTRKKIIQGLIDTDGYIKKGRLDEFSTSSKKLAEDFLEVGRSIGMQLNMTIRKSKYKKNGIVHNCGDSYRIREVGFKTKGKAIVDIRYSHKADAVCIKVDAEDELFVVNGFNLTHNTTLMLKILSIFSNNMKVVHFDFEMGEYKVARKLKWLLKEERQKDNYIIDFESYRLDDLVREIEIYSAEGVKFFVIDSKMKIEVPGVSQQYEQASKISLELQRLCRENDITIMMINQMSEDSIKNGRAVLKGGNDQQYDADIIMFLYRQLLKKGENGIPDETDQTKRILIVSKNRFGAEYREDIMREEVENSNTFNVNIIQKQEYIFECDEKIIDEEEFPF